MLSFCFGMARAHPREMKKGKRSVDQAFFQDSKIVGK